MNFLQHRVVKNNIALEPTGKKRIPLFPEHSGRKFFFFEEAGDIIVREVGKVICQISAGILNLTREQVLTV